MGGIQRGCRLPDPFDHALRRDNFALGDQCLERLAPQQRHHEKGDPNGDASVQNGEDTRVGDGAVGPSLAQEALAHHTVGSTALLEGLHGHARAIVAVLALEDDAHPTRPDDTHQVIVTQPAEAIRVG